MEEPVFYSVYYELGDETRYAGTYGTLGDAEQFARSMARELVGTPVFVLKIVSGFCLPDNVDIPRITLEEP